MVEKTGVLYVRYDKNSPSGRLIEELKEDYKYSFNKKILELLFTTEIVEKIDINSEIGLEEQNRYCYDSLKFFSRKLELAKHHIQQLTAKSILEESKNVR